MLICESFLVVLENQKKILNLLPFSLKSFACFLGEPVLKEIPT